jgi:cytochrome c-type biogenesis protein
MFMSIHDLDTRLNNTAEAAPARRVSIRAVLVGLGVVLVFGVLFFLALTSGASQTVTGGSVLVLAPAAFLAGLISFLSPCTLPILPAYFAFTFQARRERVVLMTVAFFLGLATTMVLFGASAAALSSLLFRNIQQITLIGGLIVIALGVMSLLGKGFSGAKVLDRPSASVAGSYLYGATFAVGWTACIGPILGALYTLLATQGIAVVQGAILAFIYALGLGTPLIIIATFFSRLGRGSRFWTLIKGRGFVVNVGGHELFLHTTNIASGVLLILMGVLLATGQLTALSQWSTATPMGQWSVHLEQGIDQLFFGR